MNETSKKGTLADFLELRNWKVASPPISAGPKRVPFLLLAATIGVESPLQRSKSR